MPETSGELLTAHIKDLRQQIAEYRRKISRLEIELAQAEEKRLRQAPRGTYRHQRSDRSEVEVSAALLETEGEALHIQYTIPRGQAQRGEEDAYIRWLRTPEERALFIPKGE